MRFGMATMDAEGIAIRIGTLCSVTNGYDLSGITINYIFYLLIVFSCILANDDENKLKMNILFKFSKSYKTHILTKVVMNLP